MHMEEVHNETMKITSSSQMYKTIYGNGSYLLSSGKLNDKFHMNNSF